LSIVLCGKGFAVNKFSNVLLLFYRQNALDVAVAAVKNGDMSKRRAAELYSVPRETIRRHGVGISMSTRPGPTPHFTKEVEVQFEDAIEEFGKMSHGIGTDEIQFLGGEVATESQEFERFKNSQPTRGWVDRFKKRHNITLRTPENT